MIEKSGAYLEIAVDDSLFVEVAKGVKELCHDASRFSLAELFAFDDAIEKLTAAYTVRVGRKEGKTRKMGWSETPNLANSIKVVPMGRCGRTSSRKKRSHGAIDETLDERFFVSF